jgi:hypothetical protein
MDSQREHPCFQQFSSDSSALRFRYPGVFAGGALVSITVIVVTLSHLSIQVGKMFEQIAAVGAQAFGNPVSGRRWFFSTG